MQIIKQSKTRIAEIIEALKQGKIIVYPTETCYGLGCDATNERAVKKLFAIKKRQEKKPVLVLVSGTDMIKKYVDWSPLLDKLARKYWPCSAKATQGRPGPLTMAIKIKNKNIALPAGVVGEDNTIAFRITAHKFAHDLVEKLGRPLVSTSANISAQPSPYDIPSVLKMFGKTELVPPVYSPGKLRPERSRKTEPDIIIDGGSLPRHNPSTIIRILDNKIEVLRQGELKI